MTVREALEKAAIVAWSAGMDAHDKALGLPTDAREVGSLAAQRIRAYAATLPVSERATLLEGWAPLTEAPMYVYGCDALVGTWVQGYGWKKVSIWEREWTRDDILHRGGTHWWPHLRDLPVPSPTGNDREQGGAK